MKKLALLLFFFSLIACSNDDFLRSDFERQRNDQVAEIPLDGLKLKSSGGMFGSNYYYNPNGFVDSIFTIDSWQGVISTKKYIYNDKNKIVARRFLDYHPNHMQYARKETTYYQYNIKNQIVESVTYDKDSIAIGFNQYKYANDGYLLNSNATIVNGNLVQDGSTKYQFDNFRNPFYNIYPKAYRILNYVNKNNILITENHYGNDVYRHIHTLEYNSENYIISEHISDMPLDSDDRKGYTYY